MTEVVVDASAAVRAVSGGADADFELRARLFPLARTARALRHNVTFYDALYVALAARLRVPLLTVDARLAAAPGLPCEVEMLSPRSAPDAEKSS